MFPGTALKWHSIIVDPRDADAGPACLDPETGHGAKYGNVYSDLSVLTGGQRGSVCAVDYGGQLEAIGESIANSGRIFPLECVAVDDASNQSAVTQNGVPITIPYVFNGNTIEFTQDLPPGNYEVSYSCFE